MIELDGAHEDRIAQTTIIWILIVEYSIFVTIKEHCFWKLSRKRILKKEKTNKLDIYTYRT